MLKGKLYDSVKKYIDKYLFGFDKNQIELSILKGFLFFQIIIFIGNINLNNVNLKPNKVNKFL
jgi:hypothetical protein